ncbi:hypothetical protein [Stenotrophomonas sp.]|uniref:hypothetical protein n=1 Tax=Stenotrophomonas sp. TaxID=69392 RepID=UPI0028AC3F8E|nr:hypothetical protein [Stenotrophomonas sp.]
MTEETSTNVLSTGDGARAYVAEFFANQVRRHDFRAYITTRLAADFACALAKHLAAQSVGHTFQGDVASWVGKCFPPSLSSNMTERGDRLLEEVLELLQAHGYDSARVPTLVNYVFGRPVGEPAQEVGGVMVTLAAYCSVAGLNMQADGQAELDRINQPEVMARIRAKQEAKNALHFDTPLPGSAAQPSPAGQGDALPPLPPLPPMGYEVRGTGMGPHDVYYTPAAYTAEQMQDYARAALVAGQPVAAAVKDSLTVGVEPNSAPNRLTDQAQAVDLEQQQDAARWRAIAPHLQVEWDEDELLKRWTWIDFKRDALSVPTRSRESYASLNEAMDAVIVSQAVANG